MHKERENANRNFFIRKLHNCRSESGNLTGSGFVLTVCPGSDHIYIRKLTLHHKI